MNWLARLFILADIGTVVVILWMIGSALYRAFAQGDSESDA